MSRISYELHSPWHLVTFYTICLIYSLAFNCSILLCDVYTMKIPITLACECQFLHLGQVACCKSIFFSFFQVEPFFYNHSLKGKNNICEYWCTSIHPSKLHALAIQLIFMYPPEPCVVHINMYTFGDCEINMNSTAIFCFLFWKFLFLSWVHDYSEQCILYDNSHFV